jgi:translation elongation factor EF-G
MDVQSGMVLIRASLPSSEYTGLENAIAVGTKNRGRVENDTQTAD